MVSEMTPTRRALAAVLGASKHHGHLLVLIQHQKLPLIHSMSYIVRLPVQEKALLKQH